MVKQDHPIDGVGNTIPAHEYLFFTGQIGPAPEGQHIIPRPIPSPLAVTEDFLNVGVIEKSLNKIAALLAARMVGKEGGDFCPVIFEFVTGAEQFVLFIVLVVIRDFGTCVKVVMAELQPCGACRRPVNGGLRRFFPGIVYTSV